MKVVVTGANGQLGSDVVAVFAARGHTVASATHDVFDVKDPARCREYLAREAPQLVVNTAAMHQVDHCETNPLEAFAVNAVGARNLAVLSNELGFTLAHISTDYVFDGAKHAPYVETDVPRPLNAYGNSKYAGDIFVNTIAGRYFIVRVSALFGHAPCRAKGGMNFPQLMLHLAKTRGSVRVVTDEMVSPTFTRDAAEQIEVLCGTRRYGTYHCTSEGACSWHEFAHKVFELTATQVTLEAAAPNEFPAKVPRPKYSVLENAALKAMGKNVMPHWSDALKRYLGAPVLA